MQNLTLNLIDSKIKEVDKKISENEKSIENLKIHKEKLIESKKALSITLESIGPLIMSNNLNSKKNLARIPEGFSEYGVETAIKLINLRNKPVHVKEVLEEVEKNFVFGKNGNLIPNRRKYATLSVALRRSHKLVNLGGGNYDLNNNLNNDLPQNSEKTRAKLSLFN